MILTLSFRPFLTEPRGVVPKKEFLRLFDFIGLRIRSFVRSLRVKTLRQDNCEIKLSSTT